MKKLLLVGLLLAATAFGSAVAQPSQSCSAAEATQYGEQIVNGATIQGGRWVMVKLRISGGNIMAFSFGARDAIGNIQWTSCNPTSYRRTSPGLDGNDICREYSYTATVSVPYSGSFKVYF